MNEIYRQNSDNSINAYHKYKNYYDRKAKAQPLKVNDCVFLLDPKYDSQSCKQEFQTFHWKGPYKIMKVLSDSNYIIRNVNTHQTQYVHRMRLRLFKPDYQIDDITVIPENLYPDNERIEDSEIFDNNIPVTSREIDETETTFSQFPNTITHQELPNPQHESQYTSLPDEPRQKVRVPPDDETANHTRPPPKQLKINPHPEIIELPTPDEKTIDTRPEPSTPESNPKTDKCQEFNPLDTVVNARNSTTR